MALSIDSAPREAETLVTGSAAQPSTCASITWDQAWRSYEAARVADDEINARYKASTPSEQDDLDDEWNARGERLSHAEWALFETPAPNLSGLESKLKMLGERGLVFEEDLATTLIADVRRLNTEGRA